jgi:hypothetical protein
MCSFSLRVRLFSSVNHAISIETTHNVKKQRPKYIVSQHLILSIVFDNTIYQFVIKLSYKLFSAFIYPENNFVTIIFWPTTQRIVCFNTPSRHQTFSHAVGGAQAKPASLRQATFRHLYLLRSLPQFNQLYTVSRIPLSKATSRSLGFSSRQGADLKWAWWSDSTLSLTNWSLGSTEISDLWMHKDWSFYLELYIFE